MSNVFEDAIIEAFGQIAPEKSHVLHSYHNLFLCGGEVNETDHIPPSFRDRLLRYTAIHEDELHHAFVLAEKFKDYFKENTYTDLLVFEDDIASLSTLVIILLESPGAMVELGLFCTRPELYKKLLIVAPFEHVQKEDSFIYLGPLDYIRKKSKDSVAIYPWPEPDKSDYDSGNLEDFCEVIKSKLQNNPSTEKFSQDNSGHVALLICEVINICYPIILSDVEFALVAMGLDVPQSHIVRHLYLLIKIGLIVRIEYGSSYKYYHPATKDQKTAKFRRIKDNQSCDTRNMRMNIAKSYVLSDDPQSKRRRNVQKLIMKSLKEKKNETN
jgi:hypothetical protein